MSKPDAASGSLESILASIRKSLAEQATDAPSETPASPAEPPKEASVRKGGLRQRLAGTASDALPVSVQASMGDDLADLLEEQDAAAPAPSASPAVDPPPAAGPAPEAKLAIKPPEEDPLWFLTRKDEPAPDPASPAEAPAEPILTRPEVVRASMPPFFGSTAEVAKPDPAPTVSTRQPEAQKAPSAGATAQAAVQQAPAADAKAARSEPPGGGAPLNGRGAARGAEMPGEALAAFGGGTGQSAALEAAVLELLRPMLRQWLDQNMPRLVAEALKAEAVRVRPPDNGTKA